MIPPLQATVAAVAHEKLSGTELMKDSEGYYSFQWILSNVAICQSLGSAQNIANLINSSGCKAKVLQLTMIEEDV